MKFWRLWPRTLAAQLVLIIGAAVILSNLAVAVWFTATEESMTEEAFIERLLDRTVSTAALLSGIPAREREAAVRALSSGAWRFRLGYGKPTPRPMTGEEARDAARLRTMLSPGRARQQVYVTIRRGQVPAILPNEQAHMGPIIEVILPVVRNSYLVSTFYRPQTEPWHSEVILASVVGILMTSAAAALMARRVARPLSQLAASATVAARGGAASRVPEEGPDDVKRAARAFNTMTDQVRRTLESQRQLLSAVGHDLRTPITAMRINSEFIEDEELRERIQKNLEELQELTEAVLSAARGAGGEPMRKIDLAALIDSLCTDLDELGKPILWEASGAAPVNCRPNEIRRAIRNLIENAVAYGNKAEVRLNSANGRYEVIVEDEGPGIPETDQARVFEPFVRLEASRSMETGGSGLGLTLVRAIAEGHGGTITLENRPECGLRARLSLPRETANV
jgi:signal transduction histidine kinase